MALKATLERGLSEVQDFDNPDPELEQYRTPASVAAHLLALAELMGDVEDRTVIDLGSGTGMLALGAATLDPGHVIGIEVDKAALATARENEVTVSPESDIAWIMGDATDPPLCQTDCTVIANPPFGAHEANRHADRAFLETAASLSSVSYTIHNEGSQEFVEAFVMDKGGSITHAYGVEFPLPNQFLHHSVESAEIQAELYRVEWQRD